MVESASAGGAGPGAGAAGARDGAAQRVVDGGVNAATADIDLEVVRESVRRDRPFESSAWMGETPRALGLEYSLRPRGR